MKTYLILTSLLYINIDVGWPAVDMLALSATNQFHNNIIGSLLSQKSIPCKVSIINSCVLTMQLDHPIILTTTDPTNHHQIVFTTTDPTNHHLIVSPTTDPTNQVATKTKMTMTEGEPLFYFPAAPPTAAQLY